MESRKTFGSYGNITITIRAKSGEPRHLSRPNLLALSEEVPFQLEVLREKAKPRHFQPHSERFGKLAAPVVQHTWGGE